MNDPTTTLGLVLSQEPDTPLRQILHDYDRYDLELDLDRAGRKADWEQQVMQWETCGEVHDWAGRDDA